MPPIHKFFGDKEIEVKMQGTSSQEPTNYEYKLRPVLFLVPRGAAPTASNATSKQPFGAIDTPTQGQTVCGVISNAGWVLTQKPKDIPADFRRQLA